MYSVREVSNRAITPGVLPAEKLRALHRMTLGLLAVGLIWRSLRYLLQFPFWGDETMLAVNFLRSDYVGLTHHLRHCQVAPILFLWGELTACHWLGATELSLRLLPFLAGVGGLLLFYRLTRELLDPLAGTLAVGFLAVASCPVSMSGLTKPYAFDLFWSLALLLPAVQWLKNPEQQWRLAFLVLLAPLALLASYPAVFIAGAVSLTLAWPVYRQGRWSVRLLFVALNLAILGAFLTSCWLGSRQLSSPVGEVNTATGMEAYWADGFPPTSPGNFLAWWVLTNTGQLAAYPIGAANGGSALTVLLCGVGVWHWVRARRRLWLTLCSAPFALWLIAAFLHRYPYGASGRLSQHVAPILCLLAGSGAAVLIGQARWSERQRRRWTWGAFLAFTLIGVVGMARDVAWPYHDAHAWWSREVMHAIHRQVPEGDPVVVCNDRFTVGCLYEWYWTLEGARVSWEGQPDEKGATGASHQLWGFYRGDDASAACQALHARLRQRDPSWKLVARIPFALEPLPYHRVENVNRSELFRFVRTRTEK